MSLNHSSSRFDFRGRWTMLWKICILCLGYSLPLFKTPLISQFDVELCLLLCRYLYLSPTCSELSFIWLRESYTAKIYSYWGNILCCLRIKIYRDWVCHAKMYLKPTLYLWMWLYLEMGSLRYDKLKINYILDWGEPYSTHWCHLKGQSGLLGTCITMECIGPASQGCTTALQI